MESVWSITALYTGPLGWFIHPRLGRVRLVIAAQRRRLQSPGGADPSSRRCGAACTLGDIIGESAVFAGSWAIAGAALWSEYIVDFALAWVLGILFQYFAIKRMSGLAPSGRSSRLRRGLHDRRACIRVPEGHSCVSQLEAHGTRLGAVVDRRELPHAASFDLRNEASRSLCHRGAGDLRYRLDAGLPSTALALNRRRQWDARPRDHGLISASYRDVMHAACER
jgi:hypothetical protein